MTDDSRDATGGRGTEGRDRFGPGDAGDSDDPALQDVLDALDDPDCRWILGATDEPMTATRLLDHCSMSRSTLYRKLDLLTRASFLREYVRTGAEGGRITLYERDVTGVEFSFDGDDDGEFTVDVEIERPARGPDERLAAMWSQLGDEL